MNLGERLSELKSKNCFTTEKLAQLSGVPKGTINKILNGETQNPTARTLRRLALALGCAPGELYAADEPHRADTLREEPLPRDIIQTPVYPRYLPVYGEYIDSQTAFATPGDAMINCDFAMRITEESACDDRMSDGDYAFVVRQDSVEDGQVAAVELDGELTLMRIYRSEDGATIIAEKKNAPPRIISRKTHFKIIGRVIALQCRI